MAKQREARLHLEVASPLSLRRLSGREEAGRLFRYDLTLLGPSYDLDLEALLGTGITVEVEGTEGVRYIHGIVADATFRGEMENQARYDIVLVPSLWFLDQRLNCRIFQHMSAIEVVKRVLAESGNELHDRLINQYHERDYYVQYRESDLSFICRLLEEEGVFFFFEHMLGHHTLVLVDEAESCPVRRGYDTVPFYPPSDLSRRKRDHLDRWDIVARARTARTTLRSFDFKQPAKPLEAAGNTASCHDRDDFEAYDYPGKFVTTDVGDARARIRLEEMRADRQRIFAAGNAVGLACGNRFTLRNFPRTEQNTDHLVLAVETFIEVEPQRTAADPSFEPYRCSIQTMSTRLRFRPARLTPRPFVHGPQTAIVTGPAGEEIYTDEYGRVKVQFHWDREGRSDANSSCWLRVSQAWAGAGFGAIQIPRIGQEVIVDFLEGDPDQPIITGRVYNAHQMPPHKLPNAAVNSGIRSSTVKGQGSNELTFDDTAGREHVYLRAQYDMSTMAGHDQNNAIGNHRTTTVQNGNDQLIVPTGTRSVTVKGDSTHVVTMGSRNVTVETGAYTATSKKKLSLHGQSEGVNIQGDTQGVRIQGNGEGVSVTGNGEGVIVTGNTDGVSIVGTGAGVRISGLDQGVTIEGAPDFHANAQSEATLIAPDVWIGDDKVTINAKTIVLTTKGGSITIDSSGVSISGLIRAN